MTATTKLIMETKTSIFEIGSLIKYKTPPKKKTKILSYKKKEKIVL